MAQHNITLTCPVCNVPERAVGNPDETVPNEGKFYCFACGTNGTYHVAFHNMETPGDEE